MIYSQCRKISSKLARKIREADGQLSEIACENLTHVSSVSCIEPVQVQAGGTWSNGLARKTRRRYISDGDIAPRLPAAHRSRDRWIIDRRVREESAGGCISPRYATMFDACTANARAHVPRTYNTTRIVGRARDGRVSDVIKAIMVIIIGGLRP